MTTSPFQSPGDKELNRILYGKSKETDPRFPDPKSKLADKNLSNSKGGGSGSSKSREERALANSKAMADQESKPTEAMIKANTPPQEGDEKPAITVKITHCKWKQDKGAYQETVTALMDISIPPDQLHLTRVLVGLEWLKPSGNWESIGRPAECHAKNGKAECEVTLLEPPKNKEGVRPKQAQFRFTAKHSRSEMAFSPNLEAMPGADNLFESVILYSPTRREYLCHDNEEEFKSLLTEISRLDKLQGLTLKSMETQDAGERKKIQEEIEKETDNLFDKETVGDANAAMEELILIRKNDKWGKTKGTVYIRPYARKNKTEIKGHWRKDSDATLKKNLDDLLKKPKGSKEHSPLFESEFKAKLFESDPLKRHVMAWSKASDGTNFSPEAAICRFAANYTMIESSVDLKEKKIKFGTSGSLSFGLLEGKVEGQYPWPEKGVNLLTFLKHTTPLEALIQKGRQCLLRLNVSIGANAFVGLTVAGALKLPELDFSQEKMKGKKPQGSSGKAKGGPEASIGAETHGFVGARINAEIKVSPEWARKAGDKFESLGSCGVEGGASAGAGAEAKWQIDYKNGTFHISAGAALTGGLGCKGGFSFELEVEEGFRFIGYLLHCVDYHFVVEIKTEAFKAYKNFAFTLMTLGHKALTAEKTMAVDIIADFSNWLNKLDRKLSDVKKELFESSLAQATLTNVPPEALGQALITIMQTREPNDFRSILSILYSTVRLGSNVKQDSSANHKLKWTLRAVSGMDIPDVDGPDIEAMKGEALRKGIKKIRDFGYGVGYFDKYGGPQKENLDFISKFQFILKDNEVN